MVHKHKTAKRIITYITCITAGTAFLLQALPCRAAVQTARAASGKTQGFEKIQELAAAGNAKAGILEARRIIKKQKRQMVLHKIQQIQTARRLQGIQEPVLRITQAHHKRPGHQEKMPGFPLNS